MGCTHAIVPLIFLCETRSGLSQIIALVSLHNYAIKPALRQDSVYWGGGGGGGVGKGPNFVIDNTLSHKS